MRRRSQTLLECCSAGCHPRDQPTSIYHLMSVEQLEQFVLDRSAQTDR